MQAVILAGGVGSRLSSWTGGKPKCLVDIGGRPLILHQLEALADHGIGPVLCVLGYRADEVRAVIGDRAECIVNTRYAETNSLYSLWLAREWIQGPYVLLNCDLLFHPKILDQLLDKPGNALAYDSTASRGREQTKVAVRSGLVVDIGKDLPPSSAHGESLGLLKFDVEGAKAMAEAADQLVGDGHETAWVIEATRSLCGHVQLAAINVAGDPWVEIDFPYDLDVARRETWPAIWKGRWRKYVYWRRTRWAVVGAVCLSLAIIGWQVGARVRPASVDWETVPLSGGDTTHIDRRGGAQRWWSTGRNAPVFAQVDASPVAAELRLVLPDSAHGRLRYVVAITLDGAPYDWEALTATPDTAASVMNGALGDRDRLEFVLPPGRHQLGVTLLDGHGDRMLVRVRQPERP